MLHAGSSHAFVFVEYMLFSLYARQASIYYIKPNHICVSEEIKSTYMFIHEMIEIQTAWA